MGTIKETKTPCCHLLVDPRFEASPRFTTFISCYRTPGPQKGFRRVSEGVFEGVSEGVFEGFLKGFRRVSEGSS